MGVYISMQEVLRYLGYGRGCGDGTVVEMANQIIDELAEIAEPKSTYQIVGIEHGEEDMLQIGSFSVQSRNLSKNLKGCGEAVLFAATLGPKVDMQLKRYSSLSMSRAVVLQAASAAMIEQYCDNYQIELELKLNEEGKYMRPRFSPGYGDFSLEHQKDIFAALDLPRKIGLTLTDTLIMAPSKSVTAVIGVSTTEEDCILQGCEACNKKDCEYRRD